MTKRLTTDEFIGKSKEKFGDFLDYSLVNYISSKYTIILICPIHGSFEIYPYRHLYSKYPCPKCSHGTYSANEFLLKSKEAHGDRFIYIDIDDENFQNSKEIKIICRDHGEFEVKPLEHLDFRSGGCKKCIKRKKHNIEDIRHIAESRGGKLISTSFKNVSDKLLFECQYGHQFSLIVKNLISKNNWCNRCDIIYSSEEICRIYLELLLLAKFPKTRVSSLVSSKGNMMELDGYCEELSLGFEHQGDQHYENLPRFGLKLDEIVESDKSKLKQCIDQGIKLIVIPALFSRTKLCDLKNFLIKECVRLNIEIRNDFDENNLDISLAFRDASLEKLDELSKMAIARGGRILSKGYVNRYVKLKFECGKGHIFYLDPNNFKHQGSWCVLCKIYNEIVEKYGEYIVPIDIEKYISYNDLLSFKCLKCDFVFENMLSNIRRYKTICPRCRVSK
jgi:thiol-disulfide isomerase/thioredoxin